MTPRSEEQNKAIRIQTRTKILQTALELFADEGFHIVTVSRIAKQAGISKGLVYNHFNSKEALLEAIVDEVLGYDEQIMQQVKAEDASPEAKLRSLLDAFFDMIIQNPQYWLLLMRLFFQSGVREEYRQKLWQNFVQMMGYIEALLAEMGEEEPANRSMMIGALLDGIMIHYLLNPETYPLDDLKRRILKDYCGINNNESYE